MTHRETVLKALKLWRENVYPFEQVWRTMQAAGLKDSEAALEDLISEVRSDALGSDH